MSKIYIDNPNLIVAKSIIFGSLQNGKTADIFEVMTLTSGEYLPISKMELGEVKVYGGGGLTKQTHSNYNLNYETVGIGRVGARCGCAFLVEPNSWVTDNALYISKLKGNYDLRFLVHYLNYANLNDMANTSAQPVISLKRISNVRIPLIEIETQKEISNILDEIEYGKYFFDDDNFGLNSHLSKINDIKVLHIELKTQFNLLSKLRQAYLQEAVMGKLTEPSQDNAQTLLKAIKSQKVELIKQGKLRKEKPLVPIKPEEIPFEIPDNWVWCRLGEIGILERGKSKHRPRNDESLFKDGQFPFIQTGDVAQSKKTGYKILSNSGYYNDFGLSQSKMWEKGTLCITIAANIAETGFLTFDACFPDSVVAFSSIEGGDILSNFVKYFIEVSKTEIERFAPATAQKNINLGILDDLFFPLPPLSEQKAIVAKVEGLLGNISLLESENKAQQIDVQRLMGAVLQEAFGGK